MSYSQPRDRLELRLKEIIDNEIGDVTDRRTRFDTLLAAVVDPSVVPPDQRDRAELYLSELAGRAGGGSSVIMNTLNITLATSDITGQRDAPAGTAWNKVIILKNINVLKPENIRSGKTILGVVGTYSGESVVLTTGSLALGSGSPVTPMTPPAGYDGFSSVNITTDSTVIKPENIKKDVSILGVTGTYDAGGAGTLLTDIRNIITGSTIQTINLGWRPDKLIFSWVHYEISEDPYYEQCNAVLIDSGSIKSGEDTVTFTSTGYTALIDGTYWNDPDLTPAGEITVIALKIS